MKEAIVVGLTVLFVAVICYICFSELIDWAHWIVECVTARISDALPAAN